MDTLWARTQDPGQHQLWDLRFSRIEYLPKAHPEEPQKFLYATHLGFGLQVDGIGESIATRTRADGESISALKFSSARKLSLIAEGSGFWKYQPTPRGIRFYTGYDYRTRWGWPGRALDKVLFRPIMVKATAWSFDRLKNWIEKGIHPRQAMAAQITVTSASLILGAAWIYHGLIPKLLFMETGELAMMEKSGLFGNHAAAAVKALGAGEILFGILLAAFPSRPWNILNIVALLLLAIGAWLGNPAVYLGPFNPFSLNLAMMGLSIAILANLGSLPRAGNCRTSAP